MEIEAFGAEVITWIQWEKTQGK